MLLMSMSLTTNNECCHTESGNASARAVIAAIIDICGRLDGLADLQPGREVNYLFDAMVRLVLTTPRAQADIALRHPTIIALTPVLQRLCASGECALERSWADRIANSASPAAELARFPYVANYRQLVRMETGVLASAIARPTRRLAFVGCGPLPLSSIEHAEETGTVENIDRDPQAVLAATEVLTALGAPNGRFRCADVLDVDVSEYDVIVLAALVGTTPEHKAAIVRHLANAMAPGALLLARSTYGLRTLLYPAIPQECWERFDVLNVVHPANDIVNSVIVARAKG